MQRANLNNQIFDRLTVIRFSYRWHERCYWKCHCNCGNVVFIDTASLNNGNTQSCGCLKKERISNANKKHGRAKTPEYQTWLSIKQRCYNNNFKYYKHYGGRGIKICDKWFNSFESFFADMGEKPTPKHSIDRIDNDGNYEPSNCKWSLPIEQANNTRKNIQITFNNRTHTLSQWSRILNMKDGTLRNRLFVYNWSIQKSFITPVNYKKSYLLH